MTLREVLLETVDRFYKEGMEQKLGESAVHMLVDGQATMPRGAMEMMVIMTACSMLKALWETGTPPTRISTAALGLLTRMFLRLDEPASPADLQFWVETELDQHFPEWRVAYGGESTTSSLH